MRVLRLCVDYLSAFTGPFTSDHSDFSMDKDKYHRHDGLHLNVQLIRALWRKISGNISVPRFDFDTLPGSEVGMPGRRAKNVE